MDFLPTLVGLAGGSVPGDRTIDGRDIAPLLTGQADATSPHEAFYYFHVGSLEAVRRGRWKLHVRKRADEINELYDLHEDIAESRNVYDDHTEVVEELTGLIEAKRRELGDRALGIEGSDVRPVGRVEDNRTLTQFDPRHPYFAAEYDLADGG
jgi:arylsulfatase A-like enzyme